MSDPCHTSNDNDDTATCSHHAATTIVSQLDQTLARLGDDPLPPPSSLQAEESMIRSFAPRHLEGSFQELYSILYPCLRPRSSSTEDITTASAIVMGPRGSGKTLLVERCLTACQQAAKRAAEDEVATTDRVRFRKVVVNGIVVRGEDVPGVVYEIVRQLSDMALQEEMPLPMDQSDISGDEPHAKRRRRAKERDDYLLRLRNSTFTSNLALLESTLKMAEVDRIPIVLVLDELDAFILNPSTRSDNRQNRQQHHHRQLLLYHLLDRVATPGSNLTLIGITSNFTALTQMEKRIRSRAEGTSKIVYVRPPSTYEQLMELLVQEKLLDCPVQDTVSKLISASTPGKTNNHLGDEESTWIANAFQREFRMGRDVRWFCRVLSAALSLYRLDCYNISGEDTTSVPSFTAQYLVDALAMMGCLSISDQPIVSATKQSNLCLVGGVAVDPRLQASLLDLSTPQVALLLSARRILARQAHLEQAVVVSDDDTVGVAPLTLQRMIQECQSHRRTAASAAKTDVWIEAAQHLLERGVLVPSLDHAGGGPLQYHVSMSYQTLDTYSLLRLPLHLPVAMERELDDALQRNLLQCSTALKEWGRKTN